MKQFQFNGWTEQKNVPTSTSGLLRLTDAVQEWTRQNGKGPITVHCMYVNIKQNLCCVLFKKKLNIHRTLNKYNLGGEYIALSQMNRKFDLDLLTTIKIIHLSLVYGTDMLRCTILWFQSSP